MLAVVLAGGYGTRLRGVVGDVPKALIEFGGKPILSHIVDKLLVLKEVSRIIVLTNEKFQGDFARWLENSGYRGVEVVVEPGKSNEEKLGAIGGLARLVGEDLTEDYLVIAGDNLFTSDLRGFVDYYEEKGRTATALYDIGDLEKAKHFSVAELAPDGRITRFEEKPKKPFSTLVGTGIYAFPPKSLKRIHEYLRGGNNPDNPGYFIQWLLALEPIYGYVLGGRWWDIGTPETYLEAKKFFEEKGVRGP